ncbi:MAG: polyhydroxyalkanoate synthesis repressor PhaR [Steroidobacteraceae bacterium]|nr:polyhydroxyalkanoate synthesis repressor PhaR [Steroidobacteraceae bacterium]
MSEPRVIKKYPNRRLYDTVESRYITLTDVQRLVLEKIDFVVVDKKNNVDITRSILLQVISEQEQHSEPILTQDFMIQVIRSHGGQNENIVSGYLEQCMKMFMTHPNQVRERAGGAGGADSGMNRPAAAPMHLREIGRDLAREFTRESDKDRPGTK